MDVSTAQDLFDTVSPVLACSQFVSEGGREPDSEVSSAVTLSEGTCTTTDGDELALAVYLSEADRLADDEEDVGPEYNWSDCEPLSTQSAVTETSGAFFVTADNWNVEAYIGTEPANGTIEGFTALAEATGADLIRC